MSVTEVETWVKPTEVGLVEGLNESPELPEQRMQLLMLVANRLSIPDPEYPDMDTWGAPTRYLNFMMNTRPSGQKRKSQWINQPS